MSSILEAIAKSGIVGVGARGEVVFNIQKGLIASGASIVLDGEYGTLTETAVERLQAAHKLATVGYVGKKTAKVLDEANSSGARITILDSSALKDAPWLAQMRAITGTKEIPGKANSPIIMSWTGDIARAFPDLAPYSATYTGDEIPWCGFGLAGCMARCGIRPPDGFMYALNWAKWGKGLISPLVGCVMVFRRTGGGHVSILERLEGDTAYIRGCNQSDMINVTKKDMSSFVAARWPGEWHVPDRQVAGVITNAVKSASEA